jgi:DNA mismatch repair protein MutL
MKRTIRVLPDSVANQIAAGEVVERPASVVKELIENALDAGARRIEVQVAQGGKLRIRVADDGSGMSREDAILSLDRHATSKIQDALDLRCISTLGFRGEALPSIASVSRFTLETRIAGEPVGTRIRVRGGTITTVDDLTRTSGTTVTVENLFFNAPVRAKFLNAPSAETRAVHEAISPLALSHPTVALSLQSDGGLMLELPQTSDVVTRIADLWGDELSAQLIPVLIESEGLRVRGLIQRPDATRRGFRRACLFVGDRPFRERALVRAVDRGYKTTIPEGNRPWMFLFVDTPEGVVDVNVHPTKAEVRFEHLSAVEELVERGVRAALEGEASAATLDRRPRSPTLSVREASPRTPERGRGERSQVGVVPALSDAQMALFLSGLDPVPSSGSSDESSDAYGSAEVEVDPSGMGRPRLWQVHRSWILAEARDGLLLIDQHAAHERVLFERIMERFDVLGEASQRLLFPLTIRLTAPEYTMVEDLAELIKATGFEVEGFGGNTVIVHGVPAPHPHFDAERCFREMVEELTGGSSLMRSARNQFERVAMSFACKGAIKAGQSLDEREVQELFDQLFATELPYHDVHGRPTTVRLSRAELERKFGR